MKDIKDKIFGKNYEFKLIETLKLTEPIENYIKDLSYNDKIIAVFIDKELENEFKILKELNYDNVTTVKLFINPNKIKTNKRLLVESLEKAFNKIKDKVNIVKEKKELNNIEELEPESTDYNITEVLNTVGKEISKLQDQIDYTIEELYTNGIELETDKFKFLIVASEKQKVLVKNKYHNKEYIVLTIKEASIISTLATLSNSNIVNIKPIDIKEDN